MTSDLDRLRRWERSGGTWRVLARRGEGVEIALETCSGGEVMDVLVSLEPDVVSLAAGPDAGAHGPVDS